MTDEPKKHTYEVLLPIAGYAIVEVEAFSEEEAKDLAYDEVRRDHLEEWEAMDNIVTGNVFHGVRNSIEITDLGEVE